MDTTNTTSTPATGRIDGVPAGTLLGGPAALVATAHSAWTAPNVVAQGTALPVAGMSTAGFAQVAVAGARSTDLPGSPPRGAPV